MPSRIEDYALLGDCRSAALVARTGSIDWLCWPRFDSGAAFSALLGDVDHGRWLVAPVDPSPRVERRYRPGTLILDTEFSTQDGAVVVTDLMPFGQPNPTLVRIVTGLRGQVAMRSELLMRFEYGLMVPWLTPLTNGAGVSAIAGPERVVFRGETPTRVEDAKVISEFSITAGQTVGFTLVHGESHLPIPPAVDPKEALAITSDSWERWSARCQYAGDWRGAVHGSHLILKALTYAPTGGVVAAPTTSLPEQIGGPRNWDYRYCWLRDATFTLLSLLNTGYAEEALAWREWLLRAVAGSPSQVQIMYGLAGERRLPEWNVSWLPGHQNSQPVRVGNAAAGQLQLDVYGEVMDAFYQARRADLGDGHEASWRLQQGLIEHLESVWHAPDEGIWEVRGGRKHFTHSKVMAWVAFDRAVRTVEEFGLPGDAARWRAVRQTVHEEICRNGFDTELNSFVQFYGAKHLDASLLLLPLVGFLPPDDERIRGTVAAIEKRLLVDGLVLRYDTTETEDGLPPGEGAFLACSFWLVDNLALQGRVREARAMFERLLDLRNDVGLLSEEYDPIERRQLGNFPQAFSHLALSDTARNLSLREKPMEQRAGLC